MEVEVSNGIRLFGDTRSGSQGPKFSSLPARTLHTKMGLQWDPEMDANAHYYLQQLIAKHFLNSASMVLYLSWLLLGLWLARLDF